MRLLPKALGVRGPATTVADDHPAIFRIYSVPNPITTVVVIARWTAGAI